MIDILTVSTKRSALSAVIDFLSMQDDIRLLNAQCGAEALDAIGKNAVTLVIADEDLGDMTGLEFSRRLVAANPLVYCALVSSLPAEAFHEASEGLGVLAQLPVSAVGTDGEDLLAKLRYVIKLNQPVEQSS
ncbi:MAG: response regulator [Desulfatiglandaceae bacterium]|jgi:DNA-binding NarL/FixJ family response regulator